jgi:hypothetical protein
LPTTGDSPGGKDRRRRDCVNDFRNENHAANLAGVSTCLRSLGNDDIDPSGILSLRVNTGAHKGCDEDALVMSVLDKLWRRRPESRCKETDGVGKSHL